MNIQDLAKLNPEDERDVDIIREKLRDMRKQKEQHVVSRTTILIAIGAAYGHVGNSSKIMDPTLANAIADEVMSVLNNQDKAEESSRHEMCGKLT